MNEQILAFRREFDCNPSEYARHPIPVQFFIPYGVKFRELRKEEVSMENLQSVFIQLVHKPERKVIIKRGKTAKDYWTYCNEVGCKKNRRDISTQSIWKEI